MLVRRTFNDAATPVTPIPNTGRDCVSTIAAAQNTTLNGAVAVNDTTIVLTSASGFAVGDVLCLHSDDTSGNRIEFVRIVSISSNTLTLEEPIKVAHTSGDRVNSMADCFSVWLPGGDIWEIRAINNSGQGMIFVAYAEVYASDTIA